jgi:crotonobetainyl-CoA:carnitine CoA-transferase CaiB-like acyl-CoA transferase
MALLDCQVGVLANQALNWMVSGKVPQRMGNGHANLVPYQAFSTADGEVIIAVGNDRQFERLCAVLQLPELAGDERYRTNAGRVTHRGELIARLKAAISARGRNELSEALEAAGIPAGPINDVSQVFADPQVAAREMELDLNGLPGVACPIVIDGRRQVSDRASPPYFLPASALLLQAAEALVEAGDLAAGVEHARVAAGPGRVDLGIDVELQRVAFLAPGGAGLEGGAVGHLHRDHVVLGMRVALHRRVSLISAGFRPAYWSGKRRI